MSGLDGRRFRAVSFLLQPTARQTVGLERLVEAQREVYNAALEERRGAWRLERRRVSRFEQFGQLSALAASRPEVMVFGVCPARGSLTRLDRAFTGFFRRVRAGQTPGFPRFKSRSRFDSVEYPDVSCWSVDESAGRLYLKGIGHVRFRRHRALPGEAKTLTVRREGRRYRATVFCAAARPEPNPATGRAVGIDVGVVALYATSEGVLVHNPRLLRRSQARLADAQAALARSRRGSKRRRKTVERVAAVHRKIRNQRRDLHHQLSRRLIDDHDIICHEDLNITAMTRSARGTIENPGINVAAKSGLNRSILDAGWAQLLRFVAYKAEDAGRHVIAVDARHTSQTCAACGHRHRDNRPTQAQFQCRQCGHHDHADINAARNILRAGLAHRPQREGHNRASCTCPSPYNVYPVVVENVIAEHPAVREVCVVGIPDDRWGEAVCAWVTSDGHLTTVELLEFCAGRLAKFEVPKRIDFVEALPRGATGKVNRTEVRRAARAGSATG